MSDTLDELPELPDLPTEIAPDIAAGNGKAGDELECPDCDFVAKPGPMARMSLGRHRKWKHNTPGKTAGPKKAAPKAKKESAPKVASAPVRSARRSAARLLVPVWNVVAGAVPGRAGAVMAWEAPAAGPVLDKALAGTIVDRILLQRLAREEDKWGDVFSLAILPVVGMMVDSGAYANSPEPLKATIQAMAESAIIDMLGATLAAEAERKRKLASLASKARDAGMEGLEEAVNGIMVALFAPAPEPSPTSGEPSPAPV